MVKGFLPDDAENDEHIRFDLAAVCPIHDPTSDPARCYKINTDYIRFLVTGVDAWTHSDAFSGPDNDRTLAAHRFVDLQLLLMTGNLPCDEVITMRLRQNPIYPCQLEQSFDNGITWSLAFDYALCFKAVGMSDKQQTLYNTAEAIAVANALVGIYVGDYQVIAPDMHYDLSVDDAIRDQAYCFANQLLLLYISEVLAMEQERGWGTARDKIDIVAEIVKYASGLAIGLVYATAAKVHPAVMVALEVVNLVSQAVDDYLDGVEDEPEINYAISPENQALLLCCAQEVCGGMTPSFLRFSTMFDTCAEAAFDGLVAAAIHAVVGSQRVYVEYLALIQKAFEAMNTGQRFDCPCDEDEIVFEFELLSGGSPNALYGLSGWHENSHDAGCFDYQVGSGIYGAPTTLSKTYMMAGVNMLSGNMSGEVHSVSVEFDYDRGTFTAGAWQLHVGYGGDNQRWPLDTWVFETGIVATRHAFRELNDEQINVAVVSSAYVAPQPADTGACRIARVTVRGRDLVLL